MFDKTDASIDAKPDKMSVRVSRVENGFILGNGRATRIYTDFDSMVADLKVYFG